MDANDDLVDALVQSGFVVMGTLTRIGAEHDLSLTQLRVFGILRDRRPRMAVLAAHLGLDRSTITGLIDRGEQRGLVERARSTEDGRAFEVGLTAEGRRLAAAVEAEVHAALAPLVAGLGHDDRRTLARLLGRTLPLPPTRAQSATGSGAAED